MLYTELQDSGCCKALWAVRHFCAHWQLPNEMRRQGIHVVGSWWWRGKEKSSCAFLLGLIVLHPPLTTKLYKLHGF